MEDENKYFEVIFTESVNGKPYREGNDYIEKEITKQQAAEYILSGQLVQWKIQ